MEVALAGGLLLRGHDGALRDLASVHGTYRTMRDTPRALMALGAVLAALHVQTVRFVLDAPVSNAGRLAQQMRALAATHAWPWEVGWSPVPMPYCVRHRPSSRRQTAASSMPRCDGMIWRRRSSHTGTERVVFDLHVPPPDV